MGMAWTRSEQEFESTIRISYSKKIGVQAGLDAGLVRLSLRVRSSTQKPLNIQSYSISPDRKYVLMSHDHEQGVWSPRTAKTAAHLFNGCDEVIDQTLGNTVPLLKSAISKSRRVAGGLGRAKYVVEHVPNMLDWIQVRKAHWPF
ncbi:hypothetical protein TNCV_419761 [Trichonephila clavipes]|uniref:Uncharacterized protein n=1 Tax=Trichonephila clavipes TaxID=2585209 RepID=A0A8X6S1I7_TRICX|nr:hypothetical protein TNCV_419761 [Trichonephila clavipes]